MPSVLLKPGDPGYPALLAGIASIDDDSAGSWPPPLYMRGVIPGGLAVAVVGTRDPTTEACTFARALVSELARAGFCIWSGGALGIDTVAHAAAIEAEGTTVVVMGGGLDRQYPRENIPLFDRALASGGALVSLVADNVRPHPWRFIHRNKVLAAATPATIVIQAGVKSGARSTAAAARRMGRAVCVVPHSPWDERGVGCAAELTLGAHAITRAVDVLAALGMESRSLSSPGGSPPSGPRPKRGPRVRARAMPTGPAGARRPADSLTQASAGSIAQLAFPDAYVRASGEPTMSSEHQRGGRAELSSIERAVLHVLADLPMHVDEVCDKAALPLREVAGLLLTLTLQAVVVEGPAGFYRRASP